MIYGYPCIVYSLSILTYMCVLYIIQILKRLHKRSRILEGNRSSGDHLVNMHGRKNGGRGRGRGKTRKVKVKVTDNLTERSKGRSSQSETGESSAVWNGMETDPGTEIVTGMESWQKMGMPHPILRALKDLGFTSPTEIQRRAIPIAMDTTCDVIGAAETVRLSVHVDSTIVL